MENNLLITFIVLNVLNVIIQTVKSIATIKCGKTVAAIVNAVAFGLYTFVVIYMNADLNIWLKAGIVAAANLVGVYTVKWIEEKKRKDKLWKVECTIPREDFQQMLDDCVYYKLSFNYIDIGKYYLFNFYCPTQKQSAAVRELLKSYDAKYFVSETKIL